MPPSDDYLEDEQVDEKLVKGFLESIPQDPQNPLTREKVKLGKLLYHETALANEEDCVRSEGEETYACASCHFAQAGFRNNLPQGIGEGGSGFGVAGEARVLVLAEDEEEGYVASPGSGTKPDIQPITTPSILNAAYQKLMLWNGQFGGVGANERLLKAANRRLPERERIVWEDLGFPLEVNALGFHGVETQALAGMDGRVHRLSSINDSVIPGLVEYQELFAAAFPDDSDPITHRHAALAIAAYERTVLANKAPWQRWLRGEKNAMTGREKKGALVFFGKGGCVECHTGPALNSMTFHAFGMNDLDGSYEPEKVELGSFGDDIPDDVRRGRGGLVAKLTGSDEQNEEDYKFKTPQLYNLIDSPYYGHGASLESIGEVIRYKNQAVPENDHVPFSRLSEYFVPLGLTRGEMNHLAAFIEGALHDSDLMRYVPHRLPSGNCTPVNDAQAQADLSAAGYCDQ